MSENIGRGSTIKAPPPTLARVSVPLGPDYGQSNSLYAAAKITKSRSSTTPSLLRSAGQVAGNISRASLGIQTVHENVARSTEVVADITRDLADINLQSSQVGANSGQVQQSAQGLAELAVELERLVNKFRV